MISAGDLVVCVRDCCGLWRGSINTVVSIGNYPQGGICTNCMFTVVPAIIAKLDNGNYILASWLQRIPPLAELETHREEIPEEVL